MHKLQFSQLTMDPRNQRQPLCLPPSAIPFVMQLLPESQDYTKPLCEAFNGLSLGAGVVHQGMVQHYQHQYRIPNYGPSRKQRSNGSRKAEAHTLNNFVHESYGTIFCDRSTGVHPGTWIGANNNSGAGKIRTKPYDRDRSNRTRKRRTDEVDPSVYEVPIRKSKNRGATAGRTNIPTPTPALLSTRTTAPASSAPTSAASPLTVYVETYRKKIKQKQPVEEDFDTVSLGSDTE